MEEGVQPQSSKESVAAQVINAALGGGEGAGSKISALGVMLACIWLILEWQGGAIRSEQDQIRKEIEHTRASIVQEMAVRREALQLSVERSDSAMQHELADMRKFLEMEHDRCEDRITKFVKHDEAMQAQIDRLTEIIDKELRAHMKMIEDQQKHINELMEKKGVTQ